MTQDTEDVVALRHELALISLEYAAKGLEREAGRVMRAINLIERQETDRQSLSDRIDVLTQALKPFADCVDQIADDEDDEEWAKFRLLIKDYRRARAALHQGG